MLKRIPEYGLKARMDRLVDRQLKRNEPLEAPELTDREKEFILIRRGIDPKKRKAMRREMMELDTD